jgi:hypothetical protein
VPLETQVCQTAAASSRFSKPNTDLTYCSLPTCMFIVSVSVMPFKKLTSKVTATGPSCSKLTLTSVSVEVSGVPPGNVQTLEATLLELSLNTIGSPKSVF